ncbi:MAG: hypothetical protein ABIN01_16485 [Ferruginibacter sp.]
MGSERPVRWQFTRHKCNSLHRTWQWLQARHTGLLMGNTINYEPLHVERWAYQAGKAGVAEYLLQDHSWLVHEDQYVKNYLVAGSPLKAKVEVKTGSSKSVVKEYVLPFEMGG